MSALASVLIPAYNERHFATALASARAQTYAEIEIVVCDDSPGDSIAALAQGTGDPRVRYVRNPQRLGFGANFTRCFELARGVYVKFLNDDDVLLPNCVATLAAALERHGDVTLATSRRTIIDAAGSPRPDVPPTMPLSYVSGVMSGRELGDFVLVNSMNFIGEPTTVLLRRAALEPEGDRLFRWHGREYHCLADLSLWLRLLARGAAYYHADPLSHFRVHAGQEQHKSDVNLLCLLERLWILEPARAVGFLADRAAWRAALARVRALAAPHAQGTALPRDWTERLAREIALAG